MKLRLLTLAFVLISAPVSGAPQEPCEIRDVEGDGEVKWGEPLLFRVSAPWTAPYSGSTHDKYRFWFDQRKKQYGWFRGRIESGGLVSVELQVRNGSNIDGDNFAAVTHVLSKDKRVLATLMARGGANAAGLCKATGKGHSCWRVDRPMLDSNNKSPTIPKEEVANVGYISITPGMYDKVNDGVFWANAKAIGECIALVGGEEATDGK